MFPSPVNNLKGLIVESSGESADLWKGTLLYWSPKFFLICVYNTMINRKVAWLFMKLNWFLSIVHQLYNIYKKYFCKGGPSNAPGDNLLVFLILLVFSLFSLWIPKKPSKAFICFKTKKNAESPFKYGMFCHDK